MYGNSPDKVKCFRFLTGAPSAQLVKSSWKHGYHQAIIRELVESLKSIEPGR